MGDIARDLPARDGKCSQLPTRNNADVDSPLMNVMTIMLMMTIITIMQMLNIMMMMMMHIYSKAKIK